MCGLMQEMGGGALDLQSPPPLAEAELRGQVGSIKRDGDLERAHPPHKRKRDARGAGLGHCGYYR